MYDEKVIQGLKMVTWREVVIREDDPGQKREGAVGFSAFFLPSVAICCHLQWSAVVWGLAACSLL